MTITLGCRVVPDQNDALRLFEVLECTRRSIGAERFHERRGSRRRAEPRVGVDGGDAEARACNLTERVVLLQQQLPAVVNAHAIGAVGREDLVEAIDHQLHHVVPRRADELAGPVAHERISCAARVPIREVLVQSFRPQPPVVHGMTRAPAHADDSSAADADVDAASNRADTARGRHPLDELFFVLLRETPGAHAVTSARRLPRHIDVRHPSRGRSWKFVLRNRCGMEACVTQRSWLSVALLVIDQRFTLMSMIPVFNRC
jgi:hypothetical protein